MGTFLPNCMLVVSTAEHTHAGTMLAAEVKPEDGQEIGYTGTGSKAIVLKLRKMGVYARPLGNVVYLMVTPTTSREQCAHLLQTLLSALA